jgi:pSer/pThr/pTyr-binding forkhead associated (FHA) protein
MVDYQEPSWAQVPGHGWTLIEIKNGIEVAQHALNQPCSVLGRAADLVDIELAHESCSRRHARIAFDSRGVPWLRDLGSTHGTTVNKKSLPVMAIGNVESASTKKGSRGIVLFPGDIVQFGASTRIYCVDGPPQFERGAMQAMEQQQQSMQAANNVPQHQNEVVEELERPKTLDENSIPSQHYKAWEALKAKRYKQQNLQVENERIEAKGELTEGQERQLERNRQRLASLQDEIDNMEQDLINKIYPDRKVGPNRLFNAAEGEDDVDDRTDSLRRRHTNEAETEESLVAKWKQYHGEYVKHGTSMQRAADKVHELEQQVKAVGDEEEHFFLQNELDLANDICKKSSGRQDEIRFEIKETEKLLRIVNSKIITDLNTGYIGTQTIPTPSASEEIEQPRFSMRPPTSSKSMPPPSFSETVIPPPTVRAKAINPTSFSTDPSQTMLPPIELLHRSSLRGGEMAISAEVERLDNEPQSKRVRVLGPTMPCPATKGAVPTGTLAFIATSSKIAGQSAPTEAKTAEVVDSGFDSKTDQWKAPAGQDGSGRTKLNEKFAGRY